MNEDGFSSIDHKGRAETAVKMACEAKTKSCADKSDIVEECELLTFKKIQQIWDSQFENTALS